MVNSILLLVETTCMLMSLNGLDRKNANLIIVAL